jgi:hypothetical protein
LKNTATIPLDTFAERAWYAYHCLPRVNGKLPALSNLIGAERRSNLHKFFKGQRVHLREPSRILIANALNVPRKWLELGIGEPPNLTGPFQRNTDLCGDKNADWFRRFKAIGIDEASVNNFAVAALWYGEKLNTRAIEEVAREALGRENLLTREEWARRLRDAHVRLGGEWFERQQTVAAMSSSHLPEPRPELT